MSQQNTRTRRSASALRPGGSHAPLLKPRSVGPWQLVHPLQLGAATSTYLARPNDSASGPCQYVVKVLSDDRASDVAACNALSREAYVGRKVSHPHLISVLDANVRSEPYYLATPLVAGETLRQALQREVIVSAPLVYWISRQVAEALHALHQHGWIHGDVKPENILIAPDGHVTLLDLGFARRIHEDRSIVQQEMMGTFNYIAPESVTSTWGSDGRSDLYSLGATMYESLSGRLPFEGPTLADLATQHRQAKPKCIGSLIPDLPESAISLVHQLLAKHPLRRPQSAADVVRQLAALEIETFAQPV